MTKPPLKVACPTCGKETPWETTNNFRPFCSERCKLIDLGAWADEDYKVASEKVDPTQDTPDSES